MPLSDMYNKIHVIMTNNQNSPLLLNKKYNFCLALLLIASGISCTKQTENKSDSLILTGIQPSKGSDMVSIRIDSGLINSVPISCYFLGSTVNDPGTGGYGYVDCDSLFNLKNPLSGELIKSFKVPYGFSQTVINSQDNLLIGRYTVITDDPLQEGAQVFTNYVAVLDLETGATIATNQVDLGLGVQSCNYFYNSATQEYILCSAENKLLYIDPLTGVISKTVDLGKYVNNIVFDEDKNQIMGLTYSFDIDRNFIEVFDAGTGALISRNEVTQRDDYFVCMAGYDDDSKCYLCVNTKYEVLFIELATGSIKKSYKLDEPVNDIKFWKK
jgi:hypothetical protein